MDLETQLQTALLSARGLADSGEVRGMEVSLQRAQEVVQGSETDLSAQVEFIQRVGYEAAVPITLAEAKKYADQGNIGQMQSRLTDAMDYAKKVELDIAEDSDDIRKLGYAVALPLCLAKAREFALEGNASGASNSLHFAIEYAQALGRDIGREATHIEKVAYTRAIPGLLGDAKRLAVAGHIRDSQVALNTARIYAESIGKDISEDLTEIRGMHPDS